MGNRWDDVKSGVGVGAGVGVGVGRGEAERVGRGVSVRVLVRVARHVGTNEILAPSVAQFDVVTPALPVVENVEKSRWQLVNVTGYEAECTKKSKVLPAMRLSAIVARIHE
jgi:hypothetical protein